MLQRLDDAKGGGAHLTYVGAQFRAVAVVLRQGGHTSNTEARYRSMAAHVLADLAFQAASREESRDAVSLGDAARKAAAKAPATVQASVLSRTAYGYAVAGRLSGFESCYQQGRDALTRRGADEPSWMYYLTASHLDAQAGYALSHAGDRAFDSGDRAAARPLLKRGQWLLRTGAHRVALDDETQQRRAMPKTVLIFAVAATVALAWRSGTRREDAAVVSP